MKKKDEEKEVRVIQGKHGIIEMVFPKSTIGCKSSLIIEWAFDMSLKMT